MDFELHISVVLLILRTWLILWLLRTPVETHIPSNFGAWVSGQISIVTGAIERCLLLEKAILFHHTLWLLRLAILGVTILASVCRLVLLQEEVEHRDEHRGLILSPH